MKRIIISVTNDLSTDQRVEKICSTLHQNNFEILLIGRKLNSSLSIHRSYKTKRISLLFNSGFLFYTEYNFRLFFILLNLKKDILLSNDLDTLLANYLVSFLQRKKLVYDSHELFSEIPELEAKPLVKKVWVYLEQKLLPKIKNCYTVCDSIANYYNEKYGTHFKVICNLPLKKVINKSQFFFDTKGKKIILYQGSINIGRGLELMIDTMNFLPNCLFVIIGSGDIIDELKKHVKEKNLIGKVYFLGRIIPEELQKLTPLADLGISIEEDLGLNYRYALPNKIFDYIQAEIPVLVSNLPEMKQVVLNNKVGEIVIKRNPKFLADQIESMLKKDFSFELKKARKELIWENQEDDLLTVFKNLQ